MKTFSPPPFEPDRLIRGGHLQTIASLRPTREKIELGQQHVVQLPDGDAIVLHENALVDGGDSATPNSVDRSIVLFHGLSGCHGSPYMVRLAVRLVRLGWRVYRVDMRGCGAARELASELSHAGRSEDVCAAIDFVARRNPTSQLAAAGVSLGGNQLLRLAGRIGAGLDPRPDWFNRLDRIAAIAAPIDLLRCSENMGRFSRRIYNYYFIRSLFDSIAPRVRERDHFQKVAAGGRPKTLFELDDRLTAPLSGFRGAEDYYRQCGAISVAAANPVATMVLASNDDPIVPVDCFTTPQWPDTTTVILTETGGHAGFIGRGRTHWMDECLVAWMNQL